MPNQQKNQNRRIKDKMIKLERQLQHPKSHGAFEQAAHSVAKLAIENPESNNKLLNQWRQNEHVQRKIKELEPAYKQNIDQRNSPDQSNNQNQSNENEWQVVKRNKTKRKEAAQEQQAQQNQQSSSYLSLFSFGLFGRQSQQQTVQNQNSPDQQQEQSKSWMPGFLSFGGGSSK